MDILDMKNYRIEKLPVRSRSKVELFLQKIGFPLAIIVFLLLFFVVDIEFLRHFEIAGRYGGFDQFGRFFHAHLVHKGKHFCCVGTNVKIRYVTKKFYGLFIYV